MSCCITCLVHAYLVCNSPEHGVGTCTPHTHVHTPTYRARPHNRRLQVKLFDATVACPTNGCESVLASPWGSLFGAPLPLFGMLAYGAVGAAAALYLRQAADSSAEGVAGRRTSLLALSGGVAALATTSAVLMWVRGRRGVRAWRRVGWGLLVGGSESGLVGGRQWARGAVAAKGRVQRPRSWSRIGGEGGRAGVSDNQATVSAASAMGCGCSTASTHPLPFIIMCNH